MRVGAGAEFRDGSKAFGGDFAWGHQSGAYLGANVSRTSIDDTDLSALDFGGNAGYEMSFEAMPKMRLCPTASLGYMTGPDLGTGDLKTLHFSLGGAVGTVLPASESVAIVPSAALNWVHASVSVDGVSGSASDSWGEARLAAGIVFNRAITLAPTVTIPISHDGDETRFGIAATYNFGRSSGVMQQGSQRKRGSKR
jgi:hypothetical protein